MGRPSRPSSPELVFLFFFLARSLLLPLAALVSPLLPIISTESAHNISRVAASWQPSSILRPSRARLPRGCPLFLLATTTLDASVSSLQRHRIPMWCRGGPVVSCLFSLLYLMLAWWMSASVLRVDGSEHQCCVYHGSDVEYLIYGRLVCDVCQESCKSKEENFVGKMWCRCSSSGFRAFYLGSGSVLSLGNFCALGGLTLALGLCKPGLKPDLPDKCPGLVYANGFQLGLERQYNNHQMRTPMPREHFRPANMGSRRTCFFFSFLFSFLVI